MNTNVGLWIDHKKAVIVYLSVKEVEIKTIKSDLEKFIKPSEGSSSNNPYGRRDIPADDINKRELNEHFKVYYDKVISSLKNAKSIYIFGPAETKNDLKKRMEKNKLHPKIVAIEPADKMTDRQIIARVRKYFLI